LISLSLLTTGVTVKLCSGSVTFCYDNLRSVSVSDTGGQFATGVIDTDGAPLVANIFTNFPQKIGTALLELLGPGER
jgi:hypothetical protein